MAEMKVGGKPNIEREEMVFDDIIKQQHKIREEQLRKSIKESREGRADPPETPESDSVIDPHISEAEGEGNIITGAAGVFALDDLGGEDYIARFDADLSERAEPVKEDEIEDPAPMEPVEEEPEPKDYAQEIIDSTEGRSGEDRSRALSALAESADDAEQAQPEKAAGDAPGTAGDLYVDDNGLIGDRELDAKKKAEREKAEKKKRRQQQKRQKKNERKAQGFSERLTKPPLELTHPSQSPRTKNYAARHVMSEFRKTAFLLGGAVLSGVLSIAFGVSDKSFLAEYPAVYVLLCAACAIPAAISLRKEIARGLSDVTKGMLDRDAYTFISFALMAVQLVVMLLTQQTFAGAIKLMEPAMLLSLSLTYATSLLEYMNFSDDLEMGCDSDKYVVSPPPKDFAKRAAESGLVRKNKQLRLLGLTAFLTGTVYKHENGVRVTKTDVTLRRLECVVLAIGFVLTLIFRRSLSEAVTLLCAGVSVCGLTSLFTTAVMFRSAQTQLKRTSSSLLTLREAAELADTDVYALDSSMLVDASKSCIHGVKAVNGADAKESLVLAASLFEAAHSPLADIAMRAVTGAGMTAPQARNLRTVPGKGSTAKADDHSLMFGDFEFMAESGVDMTAAESAPEPIGSRRTLYFAVDGVLSLILVVGYYFGRGAVSFIRETVAEKHFIAVCRSEPGLDAHYVARIAGVSPRKIFDLNPDDNAYVSREANEPKTACIASPFFTGDAGGLYTLVSLARKVTRSAAAMKKAGFVCAFAGILITLLIVLTGRTSSMGAIIPTAVIAVSALATLLTGRFAASKGGSKK